MDDIAKIAEGLTKAQRTEIARNLEALNSWCEDFDRQRSGWGYPRGIEVDVRDAFDVAGRTMASLKGLMRALLTEPDESEPPRA